MAAEPSLEIQVAFNLFDIGTGVSLLTLFDSKSLAMIVFGVQAKRVCCDSTFKKTENRIGATK